MNLVWFTDAAQIEPAYVERPYYLAPDGKVAGDTFAVIRDAMVGQAGLGKLALHGRKCLVAVLPGGRSLVMYTLRHALELRRMEALDELKQLPEAINPDESSWHNRSSARCWASWTCQSSKSSIRWSCDKSSTRRPREPKSSRLPWKLPQRWST